MGRSRKSRRMSSSSRGESRRASAVRAAYLREKRRRAGDAPTAAEADEACLVLGGKHKNYDFGPYQACLTENQRRVLKPARKLGCGVFACAFERDDGKVVKLTRDPEDVSALIAAQTITDRVPQIFESYELKQGGAALKNGEHTPVFALVVEKLSPFSPEARTWARRAIEAVYKHVRDSVEAGTRLSPTYTENAACDIHNRECRDFAHGLTETIQKLRDAGIDWQDIHEGNIAVDAQGRWKILDLGITGHRAHAKDRPLLEGALARALPRARRKILHYVRRRK